MPLFRHARGRSVAVPAVVTAVLAALLSALAPATAAHAAQSRTVSGGRLDWGIKASFQSYVTGPIAQGSWNLTGSAGTIGSSQFRFPSAQGSYDPGTGTLNAGFQGGVHFVGHKQSNGVYQLDLTISRPTLRLSGHSGTLYADMRSKDKDSGKVTTSYQVPLANLALGGVTTSGVTGPRFALNGVPATLSTQGARAFAGYYTAGTPLDPVSFSVDLHSPPAKTTAPVRTTAPATKTAKPATGKPATEKPGTVVDAAVDWGVRRTFREYVTGDIAQGHWTLAGGAKDGGALFRFGAGHGTYDAKKHTLDAAFTGSLRFVGMRGSDGAYGLDLTISAVRVTVAGAKGTLYADGVPFVTFTAPAALVAEKGLISVAEAPTKLTAQGAAKFNGLYTAGASMDPLTLSVALDKAAALPALPNIGSDPTTSDPTASTSPSAAAVEPSARPTDHTEKAAAGSDAHVGAWAAGAAAVLAVAALGTAAVLRRRRRASTG
ncbi:MULTISPECIES: HtaA domain-containing protein [unclassified Streptomyces]|uniref:HtaA domain-containing protein n=1 Tax=unclassified Streptomyces TaxID=2593676 RepID=UPI002E2E6F48|nr:HtaA domain-containing protein [Streptomyces sp. NBC_00223]